MEGLLLQDLAFQSGSIVTLVTTSSGLMQVSVKLLQGTTIVISVDHFHTVSEAKQMIDDQGGGPPVLNRLVYSGKQLDDDRTLYISPYTPCNADWQLQCGYEYLSLYERFIGLQRGSNEAPNDSPQKAPTRLQRVPTRLQQSSYEAPKTAPVELLRGSNRAPTMVFRTI